MRIMIAIMALILGTVVAHADEVIPANQEALDHAEAAVIKSGKTPDPSSASGADTDGSTSGKNTPNFGAIVSKEAKTLKDSTVDQRRAFGDWVSDQREQNGNHPSGKPATVGSGNSSGMGNPANGGAGSNPLSQVPPHGSASSAANGHAGGRP